MNEPPPPQNRTSEAVTKFARGYQRGFRVALLQKYNRMDEALPQLIDAAQRLATGKPVRNLDEIISAGESALSYDPLANG